MDAITKEQQRQSWLNALGLTPWVAKCHVTAAFPAHFLVLPTTTVPAPHVQTPDGEPAAHTSPATHTALPGNAQPNDHKSATPVAQPAANQPAPPLQATSQTVPKPVVCLVGTTLVIAEQADPGAPDLGRSEQQLLNALLHLFGDQHKRYPVTCPVAADHARATFATFIQVLEKQDCQQVLLCLSDDGLKHLFGDLPRYAPVTLGNLKALAISSLGDMISDPLTHKRKSWQAMQEAGFDH